MYRFVFSSLVSLSYFWNSIFFLCILVEIVGLEFCLSFLLRDFVHLLTHLEFWHHKDNSLHNHKMIVTKYCLSNWKCFLLLEEVVPHYLFHLKLFDQMNLNMMNYKTDKHIIKCKFVKEKKQDMTLIPTLSMVEIKIKIRRWKTSNLKINMNFEEFSQ